MWDLAIKTAFSHLIKVPTERCRIAPQVMRGAVRVTHGALQSDVDLLKGELGCHIEMERNAVSPDKSVQ